MLQYFLQDDRIWVLISFLSATTRPHFTLNTSTSMWEIESISCMKVGKHSPDKQAAQLTHSFMGQTIPVYCLQTLTIAMTKFQLEFWIFGKGLFSDSWHSTTTFCHNNESQQHKVHTSTSPTNNRHRCGHHVSDRYHKCHKQSGPHNCMYHWSQCSYIKNIVAILYSFK